MILIELRILKAYFQTPVAKGYRDICKTKQRGQRAGLVVRASDSEARVRVSLLTRVTVMSFSKTNLLQKSAGNTQEAVAPSQHVAEISYLPIC